MTPSERGGSAAVDRWARRMVQVGFLLLFLYPFGMVLYKRMTYRPAPTFTSWLLPWDPLLFLGNLLHGEWGLIVYGAPLLILALSLVLGRFFCGWVCPLGATLDFVRPLAWWQRRLGKRGHAGDWVGRANSRARYLVLLAVLVGSLWSLEGLGFVDPLVIANRTASVLVSDIVALQRPAFRGLLSASLVFLGIVALELWRPRTWCRQLCPLGALISLVSRWSLLNRSVSDACTRCGRCQRHCTMRAIGEDPHDTDYGDCYQCLECGGLCPERAITFRFGNLADRRWQADGAGSGARRSRRGRYVARPAGGRMASLSRRRLLGAAAAGAAAGAAGLVLTPALAVAGKPGVLRPPGALPEDAFVRACVACQECVRVCPTGGLRATFLESGLAGIGTPQLVPRQGGCTLNPSCPNLCARVCPVGAIQPTRPEDLRIGLAQVHHRLCLAWDQGVKCLVCVEACLVHAAQVYNGRVVVDATKCTGCGRCQQACPVVDGAIRVYPLA